MFDKEEFPIEVEVKMFSPSTGKHVVFTGIRVCHSVGIEASWEGPSIEFLSFDFRYLLRGEQGYTYILLTDEAARNYVEDGQLPEALQKS